MTTKRTRTKTARAVTATRVRAATPDMPPPTQSPCHAAISEPQPRGRLRRSIVAELGEDAAAKGANAKRNAQARAREAARTLSPAAALVAGDPAQAAEDIRVLQATCAELRRQLAVESEARRQLELRILRGEPEPQFPTPSVMTRRRRVSRGRA